MLIQSKECVLIILDVFSSVIAVSCRQDFISYPSPGMSFIPHYDICNVQFFQPWVNDYSYCINNVPKWMHNMLMLYYRHCIRHEGHTVWMFNEIWVKNTIFYQENAFGRTFMLYIRYVIWLYWLIWHDDAHCDSGTETNIICHFDELCIIDCTGSCQYGNFHAV